MSSSPLDPNQHWKLPPLILHPFAEPTGPAKLMQGSRASLMLSGLLAREAFTPAQLERQLLEGRYCELMMLFYIGKDLLRWADQCMDLAERNEPLRGAGIRRESFVALLVNDPPANVDQKLRDWGVYEYKRIFSRAIGMHAVFETPPECDSLSPDFIRYYHRFADELFACRQQLFPFTPISSANFQFELYASGEYSRLLEQEWGGQE